MEHKEEVQEVHRKGGGGEYNHHVDCRGEDGKRGGYEGMCMHGRGGMGNR